MTTETDKPIFVYAITACLRNPGPGGYAVIIRNGEDEQVIKGRAYVTTGNKMDLTAAIKALEALPAGGLIKFYTDSEYLLNGMTRWLEGWKKRGWLTAADKPVLNQDLWRELDRLNTARWVFWERSWGPYRPKDSKHERYMDTVRVERLANEEAHKAAEAMG